MKKFFKMKNLTLPYLTLLSFTLLFTTLVSNAQDVVRHYPFHKRGWLVLNNPDSSVVNWEVKYYKKSFVENDTITTLLERIVLAGKNYYYMPELYWNRELQDSNDRYYFTIKGTKSDNSTFIDGPHYLPDFPVGGELGCHGICNGSMYAYSLDAYSNYFTTDHAVLDNYYKQLANGAVETRVYEYMTTSQLNAIYLDGYLKDFYNLNNASGYDEQNGKVIQLTNNNPLIQYRDRNGLLISDPVVYGVQKTMGKWRGQLFMIDWVNSYSDFCEPDIQDMITKFNLHVGFSSYNEPYIGTPVPNLECDQVSYAEFNHSLPDGNEYFDCLNKIIDPQDEVGNFTQYISSIRECVDDYLEYSFESNFDDPNTHNNYSYLWPKYIAKIILKNSDGEISPIELDYNALFNEKGEYIGSTFFTPSGLYEVILVGENSNTLTQLVELKKDVYNGFRMADFLNVILYPNPLIDNSYSIQLQTMDNEVSFIYKMFDANSNLRETESIAMDAGKNLTRSYSSFVSAYPNGLMVHQFIFSDGSVKTVTGLKISH